MSETENYSENVRKNCPNCGAANPLSAVICVACGINFTVFSTTEAKVLELQQEHDSELEEKFDQQGRERRKREKVKNWKQLFRQIIAAVVVIAILGALGALFVIQRAARINERIAMVTDTYVSAEACMETENYLCAIEKFGEVQQYIKYLPGENVEEMVEGLLLEAQEGLGRQYLAAKEWQKALDQFNLVLQQDPSRLELLEMRQEAYSNWEQEAQQNKRLLEQLYIRMFYKP